jgi:hypothetical protein
MPGTYQLVLSRIGGRPEKRNGVTVMERQATEINIRYPGPCVYDYSKSHKPLCPKNFGDRLIPIVYGEPNQKTLQKAKEGKIYLGGCVLTGCDPKFYCPVHHLEL